MDKAPRMKPPSPDRPAQAAPGGALAAQARALLARSRDLNSRAPRAGSIPLFSGGRRIGLLSPEACAQISASPLSALFEFSGRRAVLTPAGSATLEETLALCAETFHAAGFFFQWRSELLDVRDLDDETVIARAERGLFRYFGMATRCVYAVGRDPAGGIFLCRRSLSKQVDPGLWDALAAGLIAAGEAPGTSLARELAEEAGLCAGDWRAAGEWLRLDVRRPVQEGWMHEDAFVLPVDVLEPGRVHNTDGEVSAIVCEDLAQVLARIARDEVPCDTALALLAVLAP